MTFNEWLVSHNKPTDLDKDSNRYLKLKHEFEGSSGRMWISEIASARRFYKPRSDDDQ